MREVSYFQDFLKKLTKPVCLLSRLAVKISLENVWVPRYRLPGLLQRLSGLPALSLIEIT
jgi:hypothetical protein